MPSRSNPNVPTKLKRKTAGVLKNKRRHVAKVSRVSKQSTPRTSQALRQSAPLSRKKARKLDKKEGYAKQRQELESYLEADVEMKDLTGKTAKRKAGAEKAEVDQVMEVD